jgi:uncharacterized membrane protein YagU involved in acid resistance
MIIVESKIYDKLLQQTSDKQEYSQAEASVQKDNEHVTKVLQNQREVREIRFVVVVVDYTVFSFVFRLLKSVVHTVNHCQSCVVLLLAYLCWHVS